MNHIRRSVAAIAAIVLLTGAAASAAPSGTEMKTPQHSSMSGPSSTTGAPAMPAMSSTTDRYGGPAYTGPPDLAVTVAVIQAGGGTAGAGFSIAEALTNMVGPTLTDQEVKKLTAEYGAERMRSWVQVFNFAVDDAAKMAQEAGITLPPPADLKGKALAARVVALGTTSNGVFWTGDMLDHLVSHKFHDATMDDIDKAFGAKADANYHQITNQAMYDLAHALGATSVKLAAFH